jgi:hypothetical protein
MNTPVFFFGDQSVNSAQFGRITGVNVGAELSRSRVASTL